MMKQISLILLWLIGISSLYAGGSQMESANMLQPGFVSLLHDHSAHIATPPNKFSDSFILFFDAELEEKIENHDVDTHQGIVHNAVFSFCDLSDLILKDKERKYVAYQSVPLFILFQVFTL